MAHSPSSWSRRYTTPGTGRGWDVRSTVLGIIQDPTDKDPVHTGKTGRDRVETVGTGRYLRTIGVSLKGRGQNKGLREKGGHTMRDGWVTERR